MTAHICILDPQAGTQDCDETLYTDVLCFGGTTGGGGFLPFFPAGGGRGPVGYPQGDGQPSPQQEFKLRIGKDKAFDILRRNSSCANTLPQEFGLSGVNLSAIIENTIYRDWTSHERCRSAGVNAFTTPTWDYVYLCSNFKDLSPRKAAEVIIHEALHSAGLLEDPPYTGHPRSEEISAKVREFCPGL